MDQAKNELPNKRQPLLSDVREVDVETLGRQQEVNLLINRCIFQCRPLTALLRGYELVAGVLTLIAHVGNNLSERLVLVVGLPHLCVANNQ